MSALQRVSVRAAFPKAPEYSLHMKQATLQTLKLISHSPCAKLPKTYLTWNRLSFSLTDRITSANVVTWSPTWRCSQTEEASSTKAGLSNSAFSPSLITIDFVPTCSRIVMFLQAPGKSTSTTLRVFCERLLEVCLYAWRV